MSDAPAFAELVAATNYSFLRGASHAIDMVAEAIALGMPGIGIADRNSVAGVVRALTGLRKLGEEAAEEGVELPPFKLVVGARLVFDDGTPDIIAYPTTRHGWGRLTRMLTIGNRRTEKGSCLLKFKDLLIHNEDMLLIAMASEKDEFLLRRLARAAPDALWLGATMPYGGADRRRLARLKALADRIGIPLLATNDALYATREQRPLHDVVTCIREGTNLDDAGRLLRANGERHLKSPHEMRRLFRTCPEAVDESMRILDRISFSLRDLEYEYPHEPVPEGWEPQGWLEHMVKEAANKLHPDGLPQRWQEVLDEELSLIRKCGFACYFLTVHDIVKFARTRDPPILCQGRGSAANSLVCYLLEITSIDPVANNLLFTRFLSEERREPPDIDVDFEHERREEVMQYVYRRYTRRRAGIAATVIHYRPRSAVREVGKALGLSEDVTQRLADTTWGSWGAEMPIERFVEAGLDPEQDDIARLQWMVSQLLTFPRHLSQHVGGYVLTEDRLDETVPIHNAAMEDRTFIEWDKDDIDELALMKVDVLALGMLTCIRKCFDLMRLHGLGDHDLRTVPEEDMVVYDMLCEGDSIGVFQVESRAQINMLPRLRPRELYDLVIQVAIVRPGPIEGDMVHPYLKRRSGEEAVDYPSPAPPHDPEELYHLLNRTCGVPLFQEQAMKLAIVAAEFTPDEANGLRRAMATFRNAGTIHQYKEKMIGGMVRRGYEPDFAARCFKQIEGFGSYGFPESHAQSFAKLVYVSSWLKCHHPAVFACGILNAQPMGFYAPAQLVRDAQGHGVEVREVDVNFSMWDNSLERRDDGALALRLGFRQVDGFREEWAGQIALARTAPFASVEELARRANLPSRALRLLAEADACNSMGLERRPALWDARRVRQGVLPLFGAAEANELGAEDDARLPPTPLVEHVLTDYQTTRLSLKGHPMAFLRRRLDGEGLLSCNQVGAAKNGALVRTAGVVLIRQRPGKGNAIFITLEDEGGIVNVLLWARQFERYRRAVMASRLMEVAGEVQRSKEGVVHLMANRIVDRTALLDTLGSDRQFEPELCRADEVAHPQQPRGYAQRHGHPRNVRILPKSRDFH
ncbi:MULTISPECIES: error-prone DNA polymerase [unclassified Sphingopyxis]|uniref:error-prone DNA polymerase n=1 Tax=unclassified Sphingopyxis TaxID=2614943 RepID=UPI0007370E50|nr:MULTISPECIES: error-prone DNA polymerase [unclassified Sphingopyxis]KTE46586.1 DNA polymerase [Sphingopyxis sp. HIX]KTE84453.1 DNA polymerase [Sphingopyxis sp. HXXIV]